MQVGSEIKKLGLKAAYDYLERDPEKNMPKLMDWLDKYIKSDVLVKQRDVFRKIINEKSGNWYQLMLSVWSDIDGDIRKSLFENIIINANALGTPKARESREKYNCNIPWVICFEKSSFDIIDDTIEQAKQLGTFMYILAGVVESDEDKEEMIAICNKHEDCQFMIFTDGSEIDEDYASQMVRVKNYLPAICVTGAPEDSRLDETMRILKSKKLPFGAYCFYNQANSNQVGREEFFDQIIGWGAKYCWFFSSLSEEEDKVYPLIKEYRESKQLLTINFCKDRAITGGCIAGGKYYCCIGKNGQVRPCVFVNESDSNINEKTLLEAYQSPLFMKYYEGEVGCKGIK